MAGLENADLLSIRIIFQYITDFFRNTHKAFKEKNRIKKIMQILMWHITFSIKDENTS